MSFKRALKIGLIVTFTLATLIIGGLIGYFWLFSPQKSTIINPTCNQEITYQNPVPTLKNEPLYWDWDQIDETELYFPQGFLWGVGISAHQTEGNCTNNDWHTWEQQEGTVEDQTGLACDHWNRYKGDIQLTKALGVGALRFSVEWSKIEPEPGIFDASALDHYEAVCKELVAQGIKPVITLFHYTSPKWFAALGGFEKEENSHYFVEFTQKVFERLHPYVHLWLTFNSPTSYVARGYYKQLAPPGIKNMQTAQEVLKNILETHVQTYMALKKLPGGKEARIGLLHNIYQIDPAGMFDSIGAEMSRRLFNDNVYGFFTTGKFSVNVPFKAKVEHVNPDAPKSLDFIGLNYYSHGRMKNFDVSAFKDEIETNNDMYTIYPEGMYRAVVEISQEIAQPLNIPIYVTENGIGTDNDEHRELFFRRYIYALSRAHAEGHNVMGYIVWSLMDNYEWGCYKKHYGLYAVDYTTQQRTLKPGARYFVDVVKKYSC